MTEGEPLRQPGGKCGVVAKQESGSLQPQSKKSTRMDLHAVYIGSTKLILDRGGLTRKKVFIIIIIYIFFSY